MATEAAVLAHLLGLAGDEAKVPDEKWDKKRAANKETSRTRKRKIQEEKEELKALKAKMASQAHSGEGGQKTPKGKGKGLKSADQAGNPSCFSWSSGTGPCGKLSAGAERACSVKRTHKCRKCLSPAHQDHACTARKGGGW